RCSLGRDHLPGPPERTRWPPCSGRNRRRRPRSSPAYRRTWRKLSCAVFGKTPGRRFQHIDDVKIALQDIKEESDSGAGASAPPARTRRSGLIVALASTVILVSAVT